MYCEYHHWAESLNMGAQNVSVTSGENLFDVESWEPEQLPPLWCEDCECVFFRCICVCVDVFTVVVCDGGGRAAQKCCQLQISSVVDAFFFDLEWMPLIFSPPYIFHRCSMVYPSYKTTRYIFLRNSWRLWRQWWSLGLWETTDLFMISIGLAIDFWFTDAFLSGIYLYNMLVGTNPPGWSATCKREPGISLERTSETSSQSGLSIYKSSFSRGSFSQSWVKVFIQLRFMK